MRKLILGAVLVVMAGPVAVRADTLDTLNASQVATGKLDTCFDTNFQPGRDKASDGGLSRKRLLAACATEWQTATEACHTNTGNPIEACRKQTGMLADDYLNLKSAGIH